MDNNVNKDNRYLQDQGGVEANPAVIEQEAGYALDGLLVHHRADI